MSYISLEKTLRDNQFGLYRLTLIAAARANELAQGALPLVKSRSKKVSTLALEEIVAGKVRYEETKPKSKKSAA